MHEEIIKVAQMCMYPWSVYYCGHGCPFAKEGATCNLVQFRLAVAGAIEDLNGMLNVYRATHEGVENLNE